MTHKRRTTDIIIKSRSSTDVYRRAIDQVMTLDRQVFKYDSEWGYDAHKLFDDPNDDDNIVVVVKGTTGPIGYLFVKIISLTVDGQLINVVQPCAAFLPDHVGNKKIIPLGLKTALAVLKLLDGPTYMVSFVVNPSMYRLFARIFTGLYPSPGVDDQGAVASRILGLAAQQWRIERENAADPSRPYFITRDLPVRQQPIFKPRCEADHFFMKHNAHFAQGDYLGVCAPIKGRLLLDFIKGMGARPAVSRSVPLVSGGQTAVCA